MICRQIEPNKTTSRQRTQSMSNSLRMIGMRLQRKTNDLPIWMAKINLRESRKRKSQ